MFDQINQKIKYERFFNKFYVLIRFKILAFGCNKQYIFSVKLPLRNYFTIPISQYI